MTTRHPSVRWLTGRAGRILLLAVLLGSLGPVAQAARTKYLTADQAKAKMKECFDLLGRQIDVLNDLSKKIEPAAGDYLSKAEYGITLRHQLNQALDRLKAVASEADNSGQSIQFLVQKIDNFHQVLPKAGEKPKGASEYQRELNNISLAVKQVRLPGSISVERKQDISRTDLDKLQQLLEQQLNNASATVKAGRDFLSIAKEFEAADSAFTDIYNRLHKLSEDLAVANRIARSDVLLPQECARQLEQSDRLREQCVITALRGAEKLRLAIGRFDRRNKRVRAVLLAVEKAVNKIEARHPGFINTQRLNILVALLILSGSIIYYIYHAQRGAKLFIRRIAGLSALDDAVGRATEMGRPIVFVTGIKDVDDVQTLAGLSILSGVAKKAAEYDTRLFVPCCMPLAYSMAQEVVKESYLRAGRPDGYAPDDIRYLTSDQFGFVAGVDGIMVREKVAACFYLGKFYAESLILAETGNSIGAIQIAGTAETAQLPFFVAACDYTLIGEELFAASAYLSGEPRLLGSLKGQDVGKAIMIVAILLGVVVQVMISYEYLPESVSIARLFAAS